MKKKLLPVIIAGLASSYTIADVSVYGLMDISLNRENFTNGTKQKPDQNNDSWDLASNASRLGFKADYAINEDLRAIAKIEYEVFVDDGDSGSDSSDTDELKARNIYAGLQGKFGTVIAGKNDSLLKMSQGKVDLFNDWAADLKNVMVGENRQDNIVIYSTNEKTLDGWQFSASFMPGEDETVNNSNGAETRNDIADGWGTSVTYTSKQYYFAIANDQSITPEERANPTNTVRMTGQIAVTDTIKLGALVQRAEEDDDGVGIAKINDPLKYIGGDGAWETQDAWLASASWEFMPQWTAKLQFASSTSDPTDVYSTVADEAQNDDYDTDLFAIGLEYQISKAKNAEAKVYAYITSIETPEQQAPGTVIGSKIKSQYDDSSNDTFAVGYQLKF
jgi:predicted porin